MVFCDPEKCAKFASNPGDPVHILYAEKINDKGVTELVPAGKENTDEFIRASADSCDIHNIIARFRGGDLEALNVRKGLYGDFTQYPKSLAEFQQLQIDARAAFDRLSAETKQKFNNDPNQFLASAGSEEWAKNLGLVKPEEKADVKAEEKADVQAEEKVGESK